LAAAGGDGGVKKGDSHHFARVRARALKKVTVTVWREFTMKKRVRGFLAILLVFGIAALFASCDMPETGETAKTPVSEDYTFGNLNQTANSVSAVTITAKSGKSPGAITIHYQGTAGTTYAKNTTPPQAAGTYAVTFDVALASGWNEAKNLSAGNLAVTAADTNKTPVASDYTFARLGQTAGRVTAVLITPKANKSPGEITIHYQGSGNTTYTKSTTVPQTTGTYAVTFDVEEAEGWKEATGLSARTLNVYRVSDNTPVAGDYTFARLGQTAGDVTPVIITAKEGKSPGAISNIKYTGSATVPQTDGTYAVTFDVDAASGWNMATGLSAGNLIVHPANAGNQTPKAEDYTIGKLTQTAGEVTEITITPNSGKSTGRICNIRYAGSATIPQTAGTYAVIFDVDAARGWNIATDLSAGDLIVTDDPLLRYPTDHHYDIAGNSPQPSGGVTKFTITRKTDASPGEITVYYQKIGTNDRKVEVPQTIGYYQVTFDVAEAPGWAAATSLYAGTLNVVVNEENSVANDSFTAAVEGNIVTIISYTGTGTTVNIPTTIGNLTVTAIGDFFLYDAVTEKGQNVTSVTIPTTVTSIGYKAFAGNRLTTVTIPDSVKTIGGGAFADNLLTGVTISNSVTTINAGTFSNNDLTSVTIPSSVTSIGDDAFSGNELTGVSIPNGVTSIGYYAFARNKLTSVTFPTTGVTSIRGGAFAGNRLTSVTIPSGVTTIEYSAFANNWLTSVTISSGIKTIEEGAFYNNDLTSVSIPISVTSIEANAFESNPLISVTIGANVTLQNNIWGASFPGNLVTAYNTNNKAAGTYKRANASSNEWTKQ